MTEPTGIRAYDLTPPSKPLTPTWQALRNPPGLAAIAVSQRRERERVEVLRVAQAAAHEEWRLYADRYVDNPVARAAFEVHQPEDGYDRVVCGSCMEDIGYEAGSTTWPCLTFERMKAAADG